MTLPLKPGESPEAQAYAAQSVEEAEFQIMMCLAAGNHEAARRALKAFGDLRGEEERAKALEVLRNLFSFVEDGTLVRNIHRDGEPGWAPRAMKLVMALKRAQELAHPEPGRTYCDRCDGCGWYEGGPTLQTTCEKCNGTGIAAAPSGDAAINIGPDRCRSTYKAAVEVERVCTLEFGHIGAHATFPAPSGDAKAGGK